MKNNSTPHSAQDYDANVPLIIPYYDAFQEEIVKIVQSVNEKPGKWLDTGCGTGTLVSKARQYFPETEFFLADPSISMLEVASSKLEADLGNRITVLPPAGTQDLPPSLNNSLDIVTAIQAHHYLDTSNRKAATLKVHQLLKPGGFFITFENTRPLTEQGLMVATNYWRRFQLGHGRASSAVENHLSRLGIEYFPITLEEHLSLLRSSGFSTVELFWYSYLQSGYYCIK